MKKRIFRCSAALILALCICLGCFASAGAMSLSEGVEALRTQWSRGNGPVVNDWDIDYSYYSPVENGADASAKYPLIIFMAGALEGQYEGKELEANEVAKLTSEDYQSRFTEGGAYVFIPRAPEEDSLYWDQSKLIPSLKAAIDDFVASNPNIDTDRIFNCGWCLGGTGAINLVSAYPDYFAGTVIMCPSRSITLSEAEILKNNKLWFISCIADSYSNFFTCNFRSWIIMEQCTENKNNIRLTTYSDAPDTELVPDVPFIENHDVWDNISEDNEMPGDLYSGMKTVDGNGNTLSDARLTTWVNGIDGTVEATADVSANPVRAAVEKIYKYFNETVKAEMRLKIFDILTVIYKFMGWL